MGTRYPNSGRVKVHLTYTIEELALMYSVHKNTIRNWQKVGLEPVDNARPILFKGATVAAFLKERSARSKKPCGPGEFFCLPCRTPMRPVGDRVNYVPATPISGTLTGLCPACGRLMYRRVSHERLAFVTKDLDVQFPREAQHIGEWCEPLVNCDLETGEQTA